MISSLASKCQEFKPRGLQFQFKKRLKNGHPNFKGLQFWSQIYVAISPSSKLFILHESNIEKLAQWDVGSWYGIKKEYIKIFSSLSPQDVKTFNWIAGPLLETISKFDRLKNWVPDCSAQDRNSMKRFYSQNMSSRCTSSPVGKIKILYFYQTLFCLAGWKFST